MGNQNPQFEEENGSNKEDNNTVNDRQNRLRKLKIKQHEPH